MTAPHVVISRLAEIDRDLADRQNEYEDAAEQVARLKRDFELEMAKALVRATGQNADEKRANALLSVEHNHTGLWYAYKLAEAKLAASQAVFRVLDRRSSIGQSILRAMTQEQFRGVAEPAWSSSDGH